MSSSRPFRPLALPLLLLVACPRAEEVRAPVVEPKPTKSDSPQPPAAGVYFAIDDRVVRLGQDGVFVTITTPTPIHALVLDGDGRLLALGEAGLLELDGDRFVPGLEFDAGLGRVEAVALRGGEIWAIGSEKIGRFADGKWTLSNPIEGKIADFANAPRGDLYLLIDDRVLHFAGSEPPSEHATSSFAHARRLAIASTGKIAVAGGSCEAALVDPGASAAGWQRKREPAYGCEFPTALALDDRERVWIGSTTGLHVLGAAEVVQAYPTGSIAELVGELRSIVVVGESPVELPGAGPVRSGGLVGRIEFRGKPAARAKLEICPRPAPIFHDSPCGQSALHFETTTDAEGRFAFEAVPLARYGWALQIGEQWTMKDADAIAERMREGEVLDLGVVRLE